MRKVNIRVVVLVLVGGVFLGGCSHKYFRTKPTTYINLNRTNIVLQWNIEKYNNTLLKMQCIDADENATTADDIGKCKEYIIADISQVSLLRLNANKTDEKNQMSKIAQDLFYIADTNCKRFQEKFFYNTLIDDTASKFIGVSFFGASIGVDLQKIVNLSHSQFELFNTNLAKNLRDREGLKESIENNISVGKNYTNEELLVDIIAYDKACSLFRVKDLEEK